MSSIDVTRNIKFKRMFLPSAVCVLFSLVVLLCIRLTVFFAGNIAGIFEPMLEEILSVWRYARVDTPVILSVISGVIFVSIERLMIKAAKKARKIITVILYVLAVIVGVLCFLLSYTGLLCMTKVNQIPFYEFVKSAVRVVSLL